MNFARKAVIRSTSSSETSNAESWKENIDAVELRSVDIVLEDILCENITSSELPASWPLSSVLAPTDALPLSLVNREYSGFQVNMLEPFLK